MCCKMLTDRQWEYRLRSGALMTRRRRSSVRTTCEGASASIHHKNTTWWTGHFSPPADSNEKRLRRRRALGQLPPPCWILACRSEHFCREQLLRRIHSSVLQFPHFGRICGKIEFRTTTSAQSEICSCRLEHCDFRPPSHFPYNTTPLMRKAASAWLSVRCVVWVHVVRLFTPCLEKDQPRWRTKRVVCLDSRWANRPASVIGVVRLRKWGKGT